MTTKQEQRLREDREAGGRHRRLGLTLALLACLAPGPVAAQSPPEQPAPAEGAELSYDERAIHRNLAYALVIDGEYRAAWPHVERLIEAGDDAAWLHLSAAQICLYWRMDYDCVEREAVRALELRPDNARAHMLLGQMAEDLGDDELAIHHYRESLARRSSQTEVSTRLAALLANGGQRETARRVLQDALVHHPRDARLYLTLARLVEAEAPDEAEAAYEQAVMHHDEPVVAWGHLLRFYERQGREDDAEDVRRIVDAAVERRRFRPIR